MRIYFDLLLLLSAAADVVCVFEYVATCVYHNPNASSQHNM